MTRPFSFSRTCPASKGSIMPCCSDIRRIHLSDLMLMVNSRFQLVGKLGRSLPCPLVPVEGFQKSYDGGCGIRPFCPKTATSTRKRVQPAITDCCRSAAHEAPLHKRLPHPCALHSGHPWPPRFLESYPCPCLSNPGETAANCSLFRAQIQKHWR